MSEARLPRWCAVIPSAFGFAIPRRIRHVEDVRLVVEHLREYGDRRAWWAAQELHRCLSPLSKRKY